MVSSKCLAMESPSPFWFFAALIPPCAQTECERFTGTMENSSTGTPDSATLIVAIKPARPPPTTMILGCFIFLFLFHFLIAASFIDIRSKRMPVVSKADQNQDAHHAERHAHQHAKLPRGALRAHRRRQSPFTKEIPDAHAQME